MTYMIAKDIKLKKMFQFFILKRVGTLNFRFKPRVNKYYICPNGETNFFK